MVLPRDGVAVPGFKPALETRRFQSFSQLYDAGSPALQP